MSDALDPNRTCFNCPSLLRADDSSFFGKSLGVATCAKFGKPIGRITSSAQEQREVARQMASKCDEFGKPKPGSADWDKAKMFVVLPDPETIGAPQVNPELVTSCAGCANYVTPDAVSSELGWPTGLCAAKGKLLLGPRLTLEARHCTLKTLGSPRHQTTGLTYLPEYEEGFVGSANPIVQFKRAQANFVDPVDYPTDKPVEEMDGERGIRAWRKVTDPASGNHVFLPIYRIDFFDEDQQAKIPRTGDDEHPEDYVDHNFFVYKVAVLWTELDETPALWGRAGTGKTELFRHMAWLMCLPFERFSINGSTEVEHLEGTMRYTEGVGTHYSEGRFVKAWTQPCVIDVDEYNLGQPDVQQFLRPCIDNSKQLVVEINEGKHYDRDLDCYLGVAMNPAWDPLNVGANTIGDADANRLMHVYVELPPDTLEREIIKKRCEHDGWEIPKDMLDMVMSIATDIRSLIDEDQSLPISWAIRPQLKAARALRWFDPIAAYKMATADYLEPKQADMVLDIVRAHAVEPGGSVF